MIAIGIDIVHEDVIGSLERATLQKSKRMQGLKAVQVNAKYVLQMSAGGGHLYQDRRDHGHMRQLRNDLPDLNRHRRTGEAHEARSARRQYDHVSSDSGLARARIVQQS